MRFSRAILRITPIVALTFTSACVAADDSVVSTDLGLARVVESGGTNGGGATGTSFDDLALRAPGSAAGGVEAQLSTGDAASAPVTAQLSPPTLTPDAAANVAAGGGASTTQPATTVAPATVAQAPASTESTIASAVPAPSSTETSVTEAPPSETTAPSGSVVADVASIEAGEAASYGLLTELRTGLAQQPLTRDAEMDAFARAWSKQMAESGTFEHSDGPYGENIAFTSNTTLSAAEAAALFHDLWINSPGHYANMTNAGYTKIGVGVYKTERGWYGTHVFNY